MPDKHRKNIPADRSKAPAIKQRGTKERREKKMKKKSIGTRILLGLRRSIIGIRNFFSTQKTSRASLGLLFAVVFIAVGALGFVYVSSAKNAIAINVSGNTVAIIKKTKKLDTEEITKQAELKIKSEIGTEIVINEKIEFAETHAKSSEINDPNDAVIKLSNSITYKVLAYKITIEGTTMAVLKNKADAQKVLDALMEPYVPQGDVKIVKQEFVENVAISDIYVSPEELTTFDKAVEILTTTSSVPETYVISAGDTLSTIARKTNMSIEELLKKNPGYTMETKLKIGDELLVSVAKPVLSVQTVIETKVTEVIEKPVQTLTNPNQPKSYKRSVQYGSNGEAVVTYHTTRINSLETGEVEEISRETVKEAVPEIIEVGTKQ